MCVQKKQMAYMFNVSSRAYDCANKVTTETVL